MRGFGGLGVCVLAPGTQDRGFAPDRSRRIFHNGKIHSTQYDRTQKGHLNKQYTKLGKLKKKKKKKGQSLPLHRFVF
jgi:hypothetical protein